MKRIWLILIVGALLGGIGAGTYVIVARNRSPVVSSSETGITPTTAPAAVLSWQDPAGFTFQYPEGVAVNKHDEDKENYAHVELTDPKHPGRIIIWEKDLSKGVTDAASWVKKDATLSQGILFDTTLGGKPAKKVLLTTPAKKVYEGTLDDDVLLFIEGDFSDDPYWQGVHDTITKSFVFKVQDTTGGQSNAAGGDEPVDEEETVE